MTKYCPIDERRADSILIRMAAFFSFLVLGAFMCCGKLGFLILLTLDFLLKNIDPKYSPLTQLAKLFRSLIRRPEKPVSFAPKQFAMRLGLIFSAVLLGLTCGCVARPVIFWGSALFISLMTLEWAFDFCVGCKIYGLLGIFRRR